MKEKKERKSVDRGFDNLFSVPSPAVIEGLAHFAAVLTQVRPLTLARRRTLPEDILVLSRFLTQERSEIRTPYWSRPALCSAYLYYFLPWNLVRMVHLLAGLPIPRPTADSLILDIGAGPGTFPLALWLAKPEFRTIPLTVLVQDKSPQALRFAKALFDALPALETPWPATPWTILPLTEPVFNLPKEVLRRAKTLKKELFLLSATNVLNEYCAQRESGALEPEAPALIEGVARFFHALAPFFRTQGPRPLFLAIEPGTRLGGKIVMHVRKECLALGGHVVAPCPHNGPCPLLERTHMRTWCHFTFDPLGVPAWLARLSAAAGLEKNHLSLAPLLISFAHTMPAMSSAARVISAPFVVPKLFGKARYACHHSGLLLLENAASLPSGALCHCRPSEERDVKSGARLVYNR